MRPQIWENSYDSYSERGLTLLAYGFGAFYFVVTVAVAVMVFRNDTLLFTVTMAMAVFGGAGVSMTLKRVYDI